MNIFGGALPTGPKFVSDLINQQLNQNKILESETFLGLK